MNRYFAILSALLFTACQPPTARKSNFEVHGIDVSHHQKNICWQNVANQDIDFAFIKATEGEMFWDTLFCYNWAEIKKTEIIRGAYHFFRPSVSPEKQALNFISRVIIKNGDLAPVLDVEVTDGLKKEALVNSMKLWLALVEEKYNIRPIIYTNQDFFNKYLAGHFEEFPFWIARYSSWRYPAMLTEQNWAFWQYTNSGMMSGITGPVDLNVFCGNDVDFQKYRLVEPIPAIPVITPSEIGKPAAP